MKIAVLVCVLLFVCAVLSYGDGPSRHDFYRWMADYNKKYDTKQETEHRFGIFKENVKKIQKWNTEKTYGEATFAVNKFSDLTPQEFKSQYASCFKSSRNTRSGVNDFEVTDAMERSVPYSWDWRTKGAVTGVKNQGQCGGCWSFSATGTLEGAHFIATGNLVGLSEQNLIDCSTAEYNEGCNGGRVDWAMEYVIKNHGIDTESSYPYTAENGDCHYSAKNKGADVTGWNQTATGDEDALKVAVASIGPIGVAISVDDAFANYHSGVYIDESCPNGVDDLDHAVLVVGYGVSSNGTDYWIVKNSWGADWGASGYILMARNYNNMCGIATDAVYSTGGSK